MPDDPEPVTDHTWNPWRGCTRVSSGCANCLHPDTRVLYADWTWRRLGNVVVGDELVGFNDTGKGLRLYRKAVVQGVMPTAKRALRLATEHTEVVCSYDHRFLAVQGGRWLFAGKARLMDTAFRYIPCHPLREETGFYKAGYVAGVTAGDGTMRYGPNWGSVWRKESPQCYWRVAVTDKPILDRLRRYLGESGVPVDVKPFDPGPQGGAAEAALQTGDEEPATPGRHPGPHSRGRRLRVPAGVAGRDVRLGRVSHGQ